MENNGTQDKLKRKRSKKMENSGSNQLKFNGIIVRNDLTRIPNLMDIVLPSTSNGISPICTMNTIPSTSQLNVVSNNKVSKNEKKGTIKEKIKNSKTPLINLNLFRTLKHEGDNIWKPDTIETVIFNSSENDNTNNDIDIEFDIQFVKNQSNGIFLKKRSTTFKYVNLASFGSDIPIIFLTKFMGNGAISKLIRSSTPCRSIVGLEEISVHHLPAEQQESPRKKRNRPRHKEKMKTNSLEDTFKGVKNIITQFENLNVTNNQSVDTETQTTKKPRIKNRNRSKNNSNSRFRVFEQDENVEKTSPPNRRFRRKPRSPKKKELSEKNYPDHITELEIEQGLKDGTLIKGYMRINQKNPIDAYVTNPNKGETDYLIKSIEDQNRALDGDEVIIKFKPQIERNLNRKTAIVVAITKMIHPRTSIGKLTYSKNRDTNFARFISRDTRFPTLLIPSINWPQGYAENPKLFSNNIYQAKIIEWISPHNATGIIIENIGASGNLKAENLAILKTCHLSNETFKKETLTSLPKLDELCTDWLEGREDLRKSCIFTIDPLTARDLDDAVSCKALPNGNFEVGVHIADVTHFLKEGTELDKQVQMKATTIYMVDQVYHMLPVELCMSCSLLPSKDKLAFSVIWEMTKYGEILNTRFCKSVINSCAQLAYEHAQAIIDNPDDFDPTVLPDISNGFTIDDIKNTVLQLYVISKNLRAKRFENGALRVDQIKISFTLHPKNGFPINYYSQEQKEANRLIEEFMLLANISVAEKIMESFPDIAFLRLHEPPKKNMIQELKLALESLGLHFDISSSKSLQSSLIRYTSDDLLGRVRGVVLNHLFAKPMTRARYFCPSMENSDEFNHYALSIPLYTHFTSPIRRYADIMVHRLLEASIGLKERPNWDPHKVTEIAENCNTIKYRAKKAQEESTKLYLILYVQQNGSLIRDAAVVDVKDRVFDVIVLDSGELYRVYLNNLLDATYEVEEIPDVREEDNGKYQKTYWKIIINYPETRNQLGCQLIVELFSLVTVKITKCSRKKKLEAKLIRPI